MWAERGREGERKESPDEKRGAVAVSALFCRGSWATGGERKIEYNAGEGCEVEGRARFLFSLLVMMAVTVKHVQTAPAHLRLLYS